eukprot:5881960-Prymnesium_polylepis.1
MPSARSCESVTPRTEGLSSRTPSPSRAPCARDGTAVGACPRRWYMPWPRGPSAELFPSVSKMDARSDSRESGGLFALPCCAQRGCNASTECVAGLAGGASSVRGGAGGRRQQCAWRGWREPSR